MKNVALIALVLVAGTGLTSATNGDRDEVKRGHRDPSEAIAVGHGAEAAVARNADNMRRAKPKLTRQSAVDESDDINVGVGDDKKNEKEISGKKDQELQHTLGFRNHLVMTKRNKRNSFFGHGDDGDFAVFAHPTYDAAADDDVSPYYDDGFPAPKNERGLTPGDVIRANSMMRRRRAVGQGNKVSRWLVTRSGNKGGINTGVHHQRNGGGSRAGASTTGRRVYSSGRRIPDTSGWGTCPKCCTWPSSWDTSCRSFYNCFSCKK